MRLLNGGDMTKRPASDVFIRFATARVIDFTEAKKVYYRRDADGRMQVYIKDDRPEGTSEIVKAPVLNTQRQKLRRLNRKIARGTATVADYEEIQKPVSEWDLEELAHGKPRNAAGNFRGIAPQFVTRAIHEEAVNTFRDRVKGEMQVSGLQALELLKKLLADDQVDYKGKPLVTPQVKLSAATFLVEHIVGKPTQPTTTDISVKLQGILGAVMVNPSELQAGPTSYIPAHMGTRGGTVISEDGREVDDDYDPEDN